MCLSSFWQGLVYDSRRIVVFNLGTEIPLIFGMVNLRYWDAIFKIWRILLRDLDLYADNGFDIHGNTNTYGFFIWFRGKDKTIKISSRIHIILMGEMPSPHKHFSVVFTHR